MALPRQLNSDHIAALMLVAMGAAIITIGLNYRMGTLVHMGAGFIPVTLGVIMTAVGILIGVLAPSSDGTGRRVALPQLPDKRGAVCILGGVAAFVLFGAFGGLVPATFASVFIAALGDRESTLKTSALLAVAMVGFGVIIFHYGLRVQLPLFTWGG